MEVTVEVFDKQAQALEYLSENNEEVSEVLYGGGARGGKCLGKGTKVRMYDLSVKTVEDIAVGDVLMGDDGTPRHVLSVSTGVEQMYWVRHLFALIDYLSSVLPMCLGLSPLMAQR